MSERLNIKKESDFLDNIKHGDKVMADRGFYLSGVCNYNQDIN